MRHRYFFYKNMAYTLTQFWFNLFTAYSGQRFYDDWYQVLRPAFSRSCKIVPIRSMLLSCHVLSSAEHRMHGGMMASTPLPKLLSGTES